MLRNSEGRTNSEPDCSEALIDTHIRGRSFIPNQTGKRNGIRTKFVSDRGYFLQGTDLEVAENCSCGADLPHIGVVFELRRA